MLMWVGIAALSALAAGIGYVVASSLGSDGTLIQAFAAGALLVMIIDTMAPEAVEQAGTEAGLATVLGFRRRRGAVRARVGAAQAGSSRRAATIARRAAGSRAIRAPGFDQAMTSERAASGDSVQVMHRRQPEHALVERRRIGDAVRREPGVLAAIGAGPQLAHHRRRVRRAASTRVDRDDEDVRAAGRELAQLGEDRALQAVGRGPVAARHLDVERRARRGTSP